MTQMGGFRLTAEHFKTASVVLALCFSLYQGASFISTQFNDVTTLKNQVGRLEVHIAKLDDQFSALDKILWSFDEYKKKIDALSTDVDQLEKTAMELSIANGKKGR